jgi:hypothetical protein
MRAVGANGQMRALRDVVAPELFGVRFMGFDPGLVGTYPRIVEASPWLSPLLPGDGLRLGLAGVDHDILLEPTSAKVLARSLRLSPGPGGFTLASAAPTIVLNRIGKGAVLFTSFSPGQVAACYPKFRESQEPLDCSGAGNAHALMRWLAANVLWEGGRMQIPLLAEAPGNQPHAVIVTGDVHDHPGQPEIKAAHRLATIFNRLRLPLSYYLVGTLATSAPAEFKRLREFGNLEISNHSARGKTYTNDKFEPLDVLPDLKQAETLLEIPPYPGGRGWLLSMRSHGWGSTRAAWNAMRRSGIGLAFDNVADRLPNDPSRITEKWFDGGERERLFVPLYEKSITTGAFPFPFSFKLDNEEQMDMASLPSAQAEPCCHPMPYSNYSRYVERWHDLFDRLAMVGGVTEVWLWHPGGVDVKNAYDEVERTLLYMQSRKSTGFLRGDVAATWRANRERYRIRVARRENGAIQAMTILAPDAPTVVLPPGAPAAAASTSYWVIGDLKVPGWSSRSHKDAYGRTITFLLNPLRTAGP